MSDIDIDALAVKMNEAAEEAQFSSRAMYSLGVLCPDNVLAILADRERLKAERDEARRHLGFSEATLLRLLGKAAEALKIGEAWTEEYLEDCTAQGILAEAERVERGLREIRAVLSELTAALAEQPKTDLE